jgi:hypothetical protein
VEPSGDGISPGTPHAHLYPPGKLSPTDKEYFKSPWIDVIYLSFKFQFKSFNLTFATIADASIVFALVCICTRLSIHQKHVALGTARNKGYHLIIYPYFEADTKE